VEEDEDSTKTSTFALSIGFLIDNPYFAYLGIETKKAKVKQMKLPMPR
jgi:hypothetical protein